MSDIYYNKKAPDFGCLFKNSVDGRQFKHLAKLLKRPDKERDF